MNQRDRQLLDLAYEFPCMLRFPGCVGGNGEPAHANWPMFGKGMGMKAHDCFHVPACRHCHQLLDQGNTMEREDRRMAWLRAYAEYAPKLWKLEYVIVNPGLKKYDITEAIFA
jgi:hypothetical protein